MKVQYFGDVNDYRKFALLRLFAQSAAFKIGVCWMMTEPDGRSDGKIRGYLTEPEKWRSFDAELFDTLCTVPAPPTLADLQRVEKDGLIPGAVFFDATTPDQLTEREQFHQHCMSRFAEAELAFFDPDNGLEISSCKKGHTRSSKFAFYDELADHYASGRSVLVYQHFPREPRKLFMARVIDTIRSVLRDAHVYSFETDHSALLLAVQQDHLGRIETAVRAAEQQWLPTFFRTTHLWTRACDPVSP